MKKIFILSSFLILLNTGFLYSNDTNVKAFVDIYFGESKDIVEEKIENNPDISLSSYNFGDGLSASISLNVGSSRYLHDLSFDFFNDQLCLVKITSPNRSATYFDSDVINFRDNLVKLIEIQYGEPSWIRKLNFSDIEAGYIKWSHIWYANDVNKDKSIKIGLSVYSYKYYSVMHIEYPPLLEAKELEEAKREEEEREKDSTLF